MRTIDVDFDVFKAITARRETENVSENDVLRALFGLPPKRHATQISKSSTSSQRTADWYVGSVRFPAGTEFQANYRGRTWLGRVDQGALVLDGRRFDTPSAAAGFVTKNSVNGWKFWQCKQPGQEMWQIIDTLRKK